MSNLIFPAFNPGSWNYTWPVTKCIENSTTTQTPASGRGELRLANYTFPRWIFTYDISYLKGDAQHSSVGSPWQNLMQFYLSVQGAAGDWLFNDPFDNTIPSGAPQVIGVGDGTTTQFLFYRQFNGSGGLDIVQNFQAGSPTVYLAGVAQSPSTYSIDIYGNLFFNTAPGVGVTISWSGMYYFRCHFLDDTWSGLKENLYQIWELPELKFKSVIL